MFKFYSELHKKKLLFKKLIKMSKLIHFLKYTNMKIKLINTKIKFDSDIVNLFVSLIRKILSIFYLFRGIINFRLIFFKTTKFSFIKIFKILFNRTKFLKLIVYKQSYKTFFFKTQNNKNFFNY